MTITWDKNLGSFYDRNGQVCRIIADCPESCLEGHPPILNLGLKWALHAPNSRPPWTNDMFRNRDTMILSVARANLLLKGLQVFKETGEGSRLSHEADLNETEFRDSIGQVCSLQPSSLADEAAIRLGVNVNCAGEDVNMRMHLTMDMAAALIPIFEAFVAQTPRNQES